MPIYEADYSFKLLDGGTLILTADNIEDAELETLEYVKETFPDALEIEVDTIKEESLKDGN